MRVFALLLAAAASAFAGVVTVSLQTSPADVMLVQKDGFTVVKLASDRNGVGVLWTTEPGSPLLPV